MKFGELHICLSVTDLSKSKAFYETLGFVMVDGYLDEDWSIMQKESHIIGLFQGHFEEKFSLNFRMNDVQAINESLLKKGLKFEKDAHLEEDGSFGAVLKDPDGNVIYFNTHPDEFRNKADD